MITLASQSKVRAKLLTGAGVAFEVTSPGVDEDAAKLELAGVGPREIAGLLADRKAVAVSRVKRGLVIGADQTLEFDGRLFDKAKSVAEARARLLMLRGGVHHLHAAVSLARGDRVLWRETVTTRLVMRDFSDGWLDGYLARNPGPALSSVGCYELEGEGVQLFESIEGDYFAILGLPMLSLLEALRREDAVAA